MSDPRPPHFPDPAVNPIDVLEQALRDKDEIIAEQYREMTAWREQLEAALARLNALEATYEHA